MTGKKGFESDHGDIQYFQKIKRCECCKEIKKRHLFLSQYKDEDGELRYRNNSVCNECREEPLRNGGEVNWGGRRGVKSEHIPRPSIIDLLEEQARS